MKRWSLVGKTLRDGRAAGVAISAVVLAMALLDTLIYPGYRKSLEGFEMNAFVEGFLGEAASIASPEGFLTAEFFSWIPLLLITLAVIGGTGALAGEEGAGTLDLLLAQPVTRRRVVLEKAVGLTLWIVMAGLAGLIGFAAGFLFVDMEIGFGRVVAATANMLPLTLLFLTLSLWAAATLPSRGSAAILVAGAVVVTYVLNLIGAVSKVIEPGQKLSPFYWAEASRVLLHGFDWPRAGSLLALAVLFLALAIRAFERRDIAVAGREWSLRPAAPLHRPRRPDERQGRGSRREAIAR